MVAHKDRQGPRCGAAPKPGGQRTWPCKRFALIGEKRCRQHGGIHAGNAANRRRAEAERKIDAAVRRLNITPVEDPLTELKKLAGEVLAWKNEMSRHVGELTNIRYGGDSGEQIRGEIQLFERAMDRCASVLTAIAKLNIDERLAAISEQQAQMLSAALFAAFDEAGLSITDTIQKKAVAKAFHRHLQLVA